MDWFRYHVTARWILAASATILAIGLLSCRREELTPVSFRVVLFGKHGVESDVAGLTLGDFDGDGDLDAWASDGSSFRIWRHRGAAEFVPEAPFGSIETFGKIYQESFNRQPTALGDVDADGDLDAVPFSGDLWLNDGQGNFSRSDYNFRRTSSEQTAAQVLESYGEAGGTFAFYYWQAALGDLDGDGDLDVLTLDGLVWLNDGSGEFTLRGPRFEHGDLMQRGGMTLGDLDGDGDLDAFVVGGVQSGTFIWRNDGNGGLTPGDWIAGATSYFGAEASLGDLDGDGDLDLCLKDRIWSNDGEGGFSGGGRIAWIRGDQYSIRSF